ncbi:hypothetical protein BMWSH_2324 [Priestia megaterium WSH-002]|uniref:DUF262 domain-containing protein n=1 Tax=Priestia megaterium (strain WSH-002) TaxID=1006007 RepID=A0A8D3WYU9_PRIMW|nr:DUF262 domain-containing protein [Priestia megaterium]AEN89206.1 hypothetical protein BMWSH_2324 [Priestia megaterium WSH-002]
MMQAHETKIQPIIEGTKQYLVPMFQRTYSWTLNEWKQLWQDIMDIEQFDESKGHFIGSIVSMPLPSAPHEVQRYLLIDGQQRLTTLVIILTAIRDLAKENSETRVADEIHETLLVNKYEDGDSHFKLLPTQTDREGYKNLMFNIDDGSNSLILKAYKYFKGEINKMNIELRHLKTIISNRLSVVSIVLASDDNPYLVFESLNAKGRPLTQSDLIRNFFFMRINQEQHEFIYSQYWQPMQDGLGEVLTEFIRHFLMKGGKVVRKNDVYVILRESAETEDTLNYIKELYTYSTFYRKLINPHYEVDAALRAKLTRLNRIEATTSYPLLLKLYNLYNQGTIDISDLKEVLDILENYLIRRFVCDIPTNELNKIFLSICQKIEGYKGIEVVKEVKSVLQNKGYPKDEEFKYNLIHTRLYGSGDRSRKTKLILETIEESYNHKEKVNYKNLSVEHIMPQTLNESWKQELGTAYEEIHEQHLHTLGNLTLTAYNAEMSNENYFKKQIQLNNSHLELNKYFVNIDKWDEKSIKERANMLATNCVSIWSYFGSEEYEIKDVKGTTPRLLFFFNRWHEVNSWRDVWTTTINKIIESDASNFEILLEKYPNLISLNETAFKRFYKLDNNAYINIDLSARDVYKLCLRVLDMLEVDRKQWSIEITS